MNRFVRSLAVSAALFAASLLPAHAELDAIALKKTIETSLASDYPKLDALYKELHAHPELAFQEVKTAARLAAEMRALGFDVTENVGKTGLVAIYKNGDGPTIMVRTELDALPMEEKTGLDYASRDKTNWNGREVFVAHSCGHDIHMASWVGTAKTLLGLKDQWRGTLMFIAQPAEEVGAGAMAMLMEGLFTRFPKPNFGFALHANGAFAHGTVLYTVGPAPRTTTASTSNSAAAGVTARRRRQPSTPLMMAARFVVDVQSVISREKDPTEFGVVSIGTIEGGTAETSFPTKWC